MRIGITGGEGVLGSILVDKIKKQGIEYSLFGGDIREKEDVNSWTESESLEAVFHLAAIVPTSVVKDDLLSAFDVNAIGTKNLVDSLNTNSPNTWMFYSSSSHVYKPSDNPIKETNEIDPTSEYGLTKYSGEVLARKYYKNLCIGRIFSMYHDSQKVPFLYPSIKARLAKEDLTKEFELYGGESERDFLNAEEIADILLKLMKVRALGIYNIGSGKSTKVKDFVRQMTSKKLKIKSLGDFDSLVANIDKLKNVLND